MSRRVQALKPKTLIRALLRANFYIHHQTGSHIQLRHLSKTYLRITVPFHSNFDLPPFVIKNILKQAELSKDEFLKLL